jgi:hypothetical protein
MAAPVGKISLSLALIAFFKEKQLKNKKEKGKTPLVMTHYHSYS